MHRTVGSIFSGVGGFDMGFEAAGFRVAWQIENDRDAVSVLERHWPGAPRYGDVRDVDPSMLAPVDVVVFGSPCQDFSVAGKRAGLAGERSGLFGEATRIIAGLRPKPAVCVWENVPGALSSARGRDFGAALDALADLGALDIAWRVLDARHWGVPQRRRRVFVVADLGGERAASILFEPESSSGDSQESGAAGQGAPGDAQDGAGVVSWKRRGGFGYSENDDVAPTLEHEGGSHSGGPMTTPLLAVATWDARNVTSQANRTRVEYGAPANTLHAEGLSVITSIAVAITENLRAEVRETAYANALAGGGGKIGQGYQAVREGMAVRRLTPLECERLMGWSDSHTRWRANGDEISDGPRYRMIGNGVVAPVAAWLAKRIAEAL